MLIKILGVIDSLIGLILIFGFEQSLTQSILLFLGLTMIAKSSLGMLKDFRSWIDVFAGMVLLISTLISLPWAIGFIIGIFVLQKGIFSFF